MPPRKTDGPEPGQAPYFVRSSGRSREAPSADGTARRQPKTAPAAPRRPPRLTGRGGVLLIVVFSFAGTMIAHLASVTTAPGLAFTIACLVTASLVRPGDLLSLSVSPPIAYFAAVVAAESLLALGNEGFARVLILGLASRLAEVAPWLFLGTALVLVIAVFRGLPGNLRTLGDELNGRE
ncbi:hypothetical protein GCM10007079_42150 [Nocardiopsis terrae]|nr:DUF6542 domain-containing protein [Nocardiopsis terrae]GHC93111.1 hypothetical protein GCM10007079_42150 [Nocardiopsis terrae]